MFTRIKNQRGFVFVEFVIALPLIVLLIYALTQMIIQIADFGKRQAAEYVLENEAHEILEQIKRDARAAAFAEVRQAVGGKELYEIFFVYRLEGNNLSRDYFKNKSYNSNTGDIVNLYYTHRYTVGATEGHGYQIYAERLKDGPKRNPISGGNFLADTVVTELTFSTHEEDLKSDKIGKILHITLELQSVETERKFRLNTSVFMPACEKIEEI